MLAAAGVPAGLDLGMYGGPLAMLLQQGAAAQAASASSALMALGSDLGLGADSGAAATGAFLAALFGGVAAPAPAPAPAAAAAAAVAAPVLASEGGLAAQAGVTQADAEARTNHWAQVFSAMLQAGLEERAREYAQYLGKLQEVTKECERRYTEAIAMEEQLLETAMDEAVHAHAMAEVQKQALAQMAAHGNVVKAEIDAAHQAAAMAVAEQERISGISMVHPKRRGMPVCQFFQRTGNCNYGSTCKWDHPDRDSQHLNSKGYPRREGEQPCSHFLRTGECKFAATCKFDHPESPTTIAAAKLAALQMSASSSGALCVVDRL